MIVIKDVKTRFGMGSTTGLGLVYSDKESMKVEPSYMHERYAELRSASAEPEEAAAETEDVSGGEE